MPLPNSVQLLPTEILQQLEAKLVASGFAGYQELADWLKSNGHEISRSALGRFGKDFKERQHGLQVAREMAIAYRQDLPEQDDGAIGKVLVEVGQALTLEYAFMVQAALINQQGLETLKLLTPLIATATRAIEAINRSDVAVAKYTAEAKGRVAALEGKPGIDQETLDRVRREIFGS